VAVDSDITFVCTPEKTVPSVVAQIVSAWSRTFCVIKSSTPPGTTGSLMEKHGSHLCHNPEFLRERHSMEDVESQNFIVIGQCCQKHGDLVASVYENMCVPVIRTDAKTSEMAKLTLNNYLATLITFWNEIDLIARSAGLDTGEISSILKRDPRLSYYGMDFFNQPFGGTCLPKDVNQMIDFSAKTGVIPVLLESLRIRNKMVSLENNQPAFSLETTVKEAVRV
jgi:nucleotide sugar dehydrogenase